MMNFVPAVLSSLVFINLLFRNVFVKADLSISNKIVKLRYCAAVGNCDLREVLDNRQRWTTTGYDGSLAYRRWMAFHNNDYHHTNPKHNPSDPLLQFLAKKAKSCSVPCQRKSLLLRLVINSATNLTALRYHLTALRYCLTAVRYNLTY